jgi:transposase
MTPYSMDLHTRVLADCDAGLAAKEVAAKFRVSRSWVNRLVQRRRETGEVGPRQQKIRSKRSPAKRIASPRLCRRASRLRWAD